MNFQFNQTRPFNSNYSWGVDFEKKHNNLSKVVSPRKPFGLVGNYPAKSSGIPCHFTQKIGLKYADPQDVVDPNNYIDKWKLLIPRAPIAGQTDFSKPVGFYYDGNVIIAKPGEVVRNLG